jgi:hypothetical protein
MSPQPIQSGPCVYCGAESQGNYSIHRDGMGIGPEVPLCDACGRAPSPSLGAIWGRIAQPSNEPGAFIRAESR